MSPVLGLAYRARGKPLSWPQARNIYNDRLQTVNGHVSPMTQRFSYKYPGALTDKSSTPRGGGVTEETAPFCKRQETTNAMRGSQPVALSTTGTAAVAVSQTATGTTQVGPAESADQ